MAIDIIERTEEQIHADEVRQKKKQDDLDKMIDKYRKKADRMERINPAGTPQPALTVEEVEIIEAELPVGDFTEADILKAVKKKFPQKEESVRKQIKKE